MARACWLKQLPLWELGWPVSTPCFRPLPHRIPAAGLPLYRPPHGRGDVIHRRRETTGLLPRPDREALGKKKPSSPGGPYVTAAESKLFFSRPHTFLPGEAIGIQHWHLSHRAVASVRPSRQDTAADRPAPGPPPRDGNALVGTICSNKNTGDRSPLRPFFTVLCSRSRIVELRIWFSVRRTPRQLTKPGSCYLS